MPIKGLIKENKMGKAIQMIEGIGPASQEKLGRAGIKTVEKLSLIHI